MVLNLKNSKINPMKLFNIFTIFSLITMVTISCSKEKSNDNDVEVKAVDKNQEMATNHALNVKVMNEEDPICGMSTADHLSDTANYKGKTYGFCNPMCKEKFLEHPEEYVNE